MRTTRDDIEGWLNQRPEGATHMIVFCDTFDHEDYPVYVRADEDVRKKLEEVHPMRRVMEVYNYSLPLQSQLNERRAFNL